MKVNPLRFWDCLQPEIGRRWRYTIFMSATTIESLSRAEIARRPLPVEDCVLGIVDIQAKLLVAIHEKERLVPHAKVPVRPAHIRPPPVTGSTPNPTAPGPTHTDILQ